MTGLAARLERDPETWQATTAGDLLVGEVLEVSSSSLMVGPRPPASGRSQPRGRSWPMRSAGDTSAQAIASASATSGRRAPAAALRSMRTGSSTRPRRRAGPSRVQLEALTQLDSRPPAQRWTEALAAMDDTRRRWVLASYADRYGDTPIDELDQDLASRIADRAEAVAAGHAQPRDEEGDRADP